MITVQDGTNRELEIQNNLNQSINNNNNNKITINNNNDLTPMVTNDLNVSASSEGASIIGDAEEDQESLNDDLMSTRNTINNNNDVQSIITGTTRRRSFDSVSVRRSFDSTLGTQSSRTFVYRNDTHSGSKDYSPLGNNSIDEIVLNTRRKNWLIPPTSHDIPPVILSKNDISNNWKDELKDYVKSINNEFRNYQNNKGIRNNNTTSNEQQQDNNIMFVDDTTEEELQLQEVPKFYFDKNFQLDNPRIFRQVVGNLQLHLNEKSTLDIENQRIESFNLLRDSLIDYLDDVENLLVKKISKSSQSVFNVLGDVDNIQNKVNTSINELEILKNFLNEIDKEKIEKKIISIKKIIEKTNVEKFEQTLFQIKLVLNKIDDCKKLYSNDQLEECLDLIKSIDFLIKGDKKNNKNVNEWTKNWPYNLSNLRTVPSLTETREYLTNLKIEIGGKYSLKFCDLLLIDIRKHCDSVTTHEVLSRLQGINRNNTNYMNVDDNLQIQLKDLVKKLDRCEELASAFSLYQDKLITELKNIIKIYYPRENKSNLELDKQQSTRSSSGSKLSKLIKNQTPDEFQEMIIFIFTHLSESIRRLYRQQKLLLDISLNEIMTGKTNNINEDQNAMIKQLDIRNGINEGISTVQLRVGKIINVRRDIITLMNFEHFIKLYEMVRLFIKECENVSGEFLTKYLNDTVVSLIRGYISTNGIRNIKKLKIKLANEKWIPFIVEPSIQKDVNDIVSSISIDPLDWVKVKDLSLLFEGKKNNNNTEEVADKLQDENNSNQLEKKEEVKETTKGHKKSVVVGDNTFVASEVLITSIVFIKDLLIMAMNLPSIYLSSFEKMVFDIFKNFNEYAITVTNQVLVSDQHKNLSIMGESLDCLGELIIFVQQYFNRLAANCKDFRPMSQGQYSQLSIQYQKTSEKIMLANAPPPPPI